MGTSRSACVLTQRNTDTDTDTWLEIQIHWHRPVYCHCDCDCDWDWDWANLERLSRHTHTLIHTCLHIHRHTHTCTNILYSNCCHRPLSSSLAGARFKSLLSTARRFWSRIAMSPHTLLCRTHTRTHTHTLFVPTSPCNPHRVLHHLWRWLLCACGSRISSINFQFIRFIYLLIFAIASPSLATRPLTHRRLLTHFPLHSLLFSLCFIRMPHNYFSQCLLACRLFVIEFQLVCIADDNSSSYFAY